MKKFNKKDIFTIPNMISYLRIILIPVFCYIYITAEGPKDYMIATAVVLFSSFTDMFDGMIARKFNMVTDLGKVLDPVSDKLTHAALAICLATRYPLMWALLALMAVKEGYMAIMGMKFLKKGKMMDGAMWFGKVCTATLFIGMFTLFLFYDLPVKFANGVIIIMMAVMIFALCKYIPFYNNMKKEVQEEENSK